MYRKTILLEQILRSILNGKICSATFLIWPSESGYSETDIRINFSLELLTNEIKDITFYISDDGQTPMFYFEEVYGEYDLSKVHEREIKWKSDSFWDSVESLKYEKFQVDEESYYFSLIDSRIVRIDLLQFNDPVIENTGVAFYLDNKKVIYCIPGVTKGTILDYLPDEWFPKSLKRVTVE